MSPEQNDDTGERDREAEVATRRGFSRRTAIKGGVLATAAISAPLLPSSATAHAYEMSTASIPLGAGTRRGGPVPVTGGVAHAHSASGAPPAHGVDGAPPAHLAFAPVDVDTFCMVGLSWSGSPGSASVRTARGGGAWAKWYELTGSAEEAPDDGGAEPGRCFTQPAWVGEADRLEVTVPADAADVLVHLIGQTEHRVVDLTHPSAGAVPFIIPRSSWTSEPPVGTPQIAANLQLAVVHHSVTTNNYSPEQVPQILRGIREYHVGANGWSDIGYNFAIDRFGRIWEARAGGIDKAVIGGHAFGWNTGSTGVVFLGDFTAGGTDPGGRDIAALVALLKWKFNVAHRVDPSGSTVFTPLSSGRFPAGVPVGCRTVVSHRDVGQTACPGNPVVNRLDGVWRELVRLEDVRGIATSPRGGYYLVTGYGAVHTRRGAPFLGSMNGEPLNAPTLTMVPTPSGNGQWILAADGGIFAFGNATFHGSTGNIRLNRPVVGMARTRSGNGYWLVASDGGIFAYGDARFFGSMGGRPLNQPVVGMAPTASGNGYWLVAADAGVFAFGDARFVGSGGGQALPAPAVAVGPHPQGIGYWVALADGRVLPFGVPDHGSPWSDLRDPVVGIAVTPSGGGYLLARRSGLVHAAGDAVA